MSVDFNSNILIDGNSIDQGVFSNGSINTTYNYDHNAWVYGSSTIVNNSFMNPGHLADMLNLTTGACVVKNNKFIRNTQRINTYITRHHSVSNDYIGVDQITDNIFDSSDIGDGYTTALVSGLNVNSTYTRNKNQTFIVYFPIYDNSNGLASVGANSFSRYLDSGATSGYNMMRFGNKNLITVFESLTTGTPLPSDNTGLIASRQWNLDLHVPKGAKPLFARVGGFCSAGNKSTFTGTPGFYVIIKSHDPADSLNANNTSATYVRYSKFEFDLTNSTVLSNLKSTTQFTNISSSSGGSTSDGNYSGFIRPDFFTIGNGYVQELEFAVTIGFDDENWIMKFTPVELTCQW